MPTNSDHLLRRSITQIHTVVSEGHIEPQILNQHDYKVFTSHGSRPAMHMSTRFFTSISATCCPGTFPASRHPNLTEEALAYGSITKPLSLDGALVTR
eukprot:469215-Amphidinium_carterae.1